MARISINDRQIVVSESSPDSLLRLRPGYIDMARGTESVPVDEFGNPMVRLPSNDPGGDGGGLISVPSFSLGTPSNIEVERQAVRVAPDGSAKIDLTVSFLEVAGAIRYEARVTKE